jgi:carbon-monoxide dehydrogenase medium subunit
MQAFAYARPESEAEVLELLAAHGREARLLAGGTDLMVGLRSGKLRPRVVIDIKRAGDLRPSIEEEDGRVAISATTVLTDVIENAAVRHNFPALVEAASTVGSVQIRNRATLVGNICNASPAADTAPALLVYQAAVVLATAGGTRRLLLDDFFVGPGQTVLRPGELVQSIELPKPGPPFGAAFGRFTRRRGVDLAGVSVCCSVDSSGVTRFGFGAVGPRPLLVADRTGVLADPAADQGGRERALEQLVGQASPISDVRASREYRRAMLPVLSRRVLAAAIDRRSWR